MDGLTDGQTAVSWLCRIRCIACSRTVKRLDPLKKYENLPEVFKMFRSILAAKTAIQSLFHPQYRLLLQLRTCSQDWKEMLRTRPVRIAQWNRMSTNCENQLPVKSKMTYTASIFSALNRNNSAPDIVRFRSNLVISLITWHSATHARVATIDAARDRWSEL